jgi:competence protein ComEA
MLLSGAACDRTPGHRGPAGDQPPAGAQQTHGSGLARSRIDLNHASVQALEALPGIGRAYAQAIVAGRPYANKTQLRARLIVPLKVYEQIEGLVVAHHATPGNP